MRKVSIGLLATLTCAAFAQKPSSQVLDEAQRAQSLGDFQQSLRTYTTALSAAKSAGDTAAASEAALGSARTIQLWSQREKEKQSLLPSAIDMYQYVIHSGTLDQRLLAANNLAVLYLEQGKSQEALETLRAAPASPPVNTRDLALRGEGFIYRYNRGRVLEANRSFDEAYREYRLALSVRPGFKPAAEAAYRILEETSPAPVAAAAELSNHLIASGQIEVAGARIHTLLTRWSRETDAQKLLASLVQYYVAASLMPPEFFRQESPRLTDLQEQSDNLHEPIQEIRLAYLGKFEIVPPAKLFPSWTGTQEFYAPFNSLLKKLGSYYERQGDVALALPRYWLAWSMDKTDTSAVLSCATVLRDQRAQLDPDGHLLDKLVEGVFAQKGMAYRKQDWLNILHYHMVLGAIFERQERWGPEWDSHTAAFQWSHAAEAERQYRHIQPDYPPSPGLYAHLAEAYRQTGHTDAAWAQYLAAAEGFLHYGRPGDAQAALAKAGALPGALSPDQQARLQRVQSMIEKSLAALPQ